MILSLDRWLRKYEAINDRKVDRCSSPYPQPADGTACPQKQILFLEKLRIERSGRWRFLFENPD